MILNEDAVKTATKFIKQFEGCSLRAYPDVASPLYAALSKAGLLTKYNSGQCVIPTSLAGLSGAPWSIGYGETQGVQQGDVWTQQQADSRLDVRVREFMKNAMAVSPNLSRMSANAVAAVTSLCYNIGLGNYRASTVARKIEAGDKQGACEAFGMWVKAQGQTLAGLVARRKAEAALFIS